MFRRSSIAALIIMTPIVAFSQSDRHDRGRFVEPRNEFIDSVKSSLKKFRMKDEQKKKEFRMDFSPLKVPDSVGQFTSVWHFKPISQGLSGMCWCFSATSFYESEIYRLTKRSIKLSELYTVYWEYVEKARRYVRERGNSEFGQGSEANAVPRIWKMYGIVPADMYTGLLGGQPFHDHDTMFSELKQYLASLKAGNVWNEDETTETVRAILDHYIGRPPEKVNVGGKEVTPQQYLEKVVRLNLDDYVGFMSLMEKPYYEKVEYEVPDNWWHNRDYFNVPLDEFMAVIRKALRSGHSVCIGGDTSEPGLDGHAGVAAVPTFDIPAAYIDENARQLRFSNRTTGDDHGIHIVGYLDREGKDWYLIKDSGSGSRNNIHSGYYFYHEDYVKLKMLGITVHKDVAKDILTKFK